MSEALCEHIIILSSWHKGLQNLCSNLRLGCSAIMNHVDSTCNPTMVYIVRFSYFDW